MKFVKHFFKLIIRFFSRKGKIGLPDGLYDGAVVYDGTNQMFKFYDGKKWRKVEGKDFDKFQAKQGID